MSRVMEGLKGHLHLCTFWFGLSGGLGPSWLFCTEQYILSRMGAFWSWGSSPLTSLSSSLSLPHPLSFYPFFLHFFFLSLGSVPSVWGLPEQYLNGHHAQ